MIRLRSLLASLALAALVTGPARADEIDTGDLYQKVVRSCVYIISPAKGGFGAGSGALIDAEQRIVLTNEHVVDDNKYVFLQFPIFDKDGKIVGDKDTYMARIPENKAIRGTVLARDPTRDLAFIKLDSLPEGTKALPLARTSVKSGVRTFNIGSPGKVQHLFSMTPGLVRTVGFTTLDFGDGKPLKATVVTATNPINPGDSGGPLFNTQGQQVAVTQSSKHGGIQQVNTFIDVSEVRAYMKELKITIKELVGEDGKTIGEKPTGVGKKDSEIPVTPKDAVLKTPVAKDAPKVAAPAPKVEPKVEPAGPSAADEEAAQKRLNYAQNIGSGNAKRYTEILTEIITKWPGTKAAKEAEKIKTTIK
jgi:S1-C subfamily serine protease